MKRLILAAIAAAAIANLAACGSQDTYNAGYEYGYHHASQFLAWSNTPAAANGGDSSVWCGLHSPGSQWQAGCVAGLAASP